jgi:hypothetical protein
MNKDDLKAGMLLRISAGTGFYTTDRWASIIRVISVNRSKGKVIGIQYKTLAIRNADCSNWLGYKPSKTSANVFGHFDDWWKTFEPKIML